jgi:hypothetical protein
MSTPSGSCRSGASGGLRRAGRAAGLGLSAGLLGLCALAAAGEGEEPKVTAKERLPVYAWFSVDPAQTTVERYRELAEAGFTHSMTFFPNADAQAKALDAAKAAGILLLISCPELKKDPPGTVKRFMDHPAVGGWFLTDEPSAADFDKLAKWLSQIEAADKNPAHLAYINLLPNYANAGQLGAATYQEHVDRFVKAVPVKVVSFDHYPITGGALRAEWYENLEIIAKAARTAKKPFYGFALSVAHWGYPVATVAHLRLQVYSNLAYGAQGIEYFTYWTPPKDAGADFHDAPIGLDGKRTVVYDRVKQVNEELRGLSGVFLGSQVLALGHTGTLPRGTAAYKPEAPVTALKTDGGAVVSLLGREARRYLVIVNRDFNKPMTLELAWEAATPLARVGKDGKESALPGGTLRASVEPGDALILTWQAK